MATATQCEIRVMFARRRKDLVDVFNKAGDVVKDGADVGGDVRVAWDSDNEDECRAVGKLFDELNAKGYRAVKVGDDGKLGDGQAIKKFEKGAGRMVMIPAMMGGS
jgi:hypothetical protein